MAKRAKQRTLALNQIVTLQAVRVLTGDKDEEEERLQQRGSLRGAWGGQIHERVLTVFPESMISIGTTYVTLEDLEARGYLISWFEESGQGGRVGRPRKYYAITNPGRTALEVTVRGINNGQRQEGGAEALRLPAFADSSKA
jgi:hypothetical protein